MECLPLDVLSLICEKLHPNHVFQLWKCGSKKLNKAIVNGPGRALQFTIKDGRYRYWPTFATYLPNLDSLSITWSRFAEGALKKPRLHELAATQLKTLKLHYIGACEELTACIKQKVPFVSSLEELEIVDMDAMPEMLPPNLTRLVLFGKPQDSFKLDGYIPPSVTSLSLPLMKFSGNSFSQHLTTLYLSPTSLAFVSSLPASLTSLTLSVSLIHSHYDEAPECPTLDHLTALTALSMSHSRPWSDDVFSSLPVTLTALQFYFSLPNLLTPSIEHVHFPPNLTDLSVPFHPMNSLQPIVALSSLQNLHFASMDGLGALNLSNVFTSLQSLSLEGTELTTEAVASLPKKFAKLVMKTLTDALIAVLPPSLLVLKCSKSSVSCAGLAKLPKWLQEATFYNLEISNFKADFCKNLPSDLRSLRITFPSGAEVPALDYWNMPTSIETLTATLAKKAKFTNYKNFDKTHTRLTHLSLVAGDNAIEPLLKRLPLSLALLSVHSSNWSNELTKLLPAELVYLTLSSRDSTFDDNGVAFLPRSICSVYLPSTSKVTEECIKDLPPGLRTFKIGYMTPNWWNSRTKSSM